MQDLSVPEVHLHLEFLDGIVNDLLVLLVVSGQVILTQYVVSLSEGSLFEKGFSSQFLLQLLGVELGEGVSWLLNLSALASQTSADASLMKRKFMFLTLYFFEFIVSFLLPDFDILLSFFCLLHLHKSDITLLFWIFCSLEIY